MKFKIENKKVTITGAINECEIEEIAGEGQQWRLWCFGPVRHQINNVKKYYPKSYDVVGLNEEQNDSKKCHSFSFKRKKKEGVEMLLNAIEKLNQKDANTSEILNNLNEKYKQEFQNNG